MKRKHIAKRKYRYSLFPTDEQTDAFFDKYPDPMQRFEKLLSLVGEVRYMHNPCPFKDCPNRKNKALGNQILLDNVVAYYGVLLDTNECLDRYRAMREDTSRYCYFDPEGRSHHIYQLDYMERQEVKFCICGYKEAVWEETEKGWIFRYKEEDLENLEDYEKRHIHKNI
jgi:hypothetical protein